MVRSIRLGAAAVAFSAFAAASGAVGQSVPIVQPGAPGQPSALLTPEQAVKFANRSFVQADIDFMSGMIHHHSQAIEMTALAKTRSTNRDVLALASRIAASQKDEIKFMREWLAARGQAAGEPMSMAGGHGSMSGMMMHGAIMMKGMATPEQMAALAAAKGVEFDRLFLKLMSTHHAGAVKMVEDLLHQPGAAYDPVLFQFTSDVTNEQTAEIRRMTALAGTLSTDPRDGLKAGFRDAGVAALNMALVTSLPRPPGFFDPQNPADLPPLKASQGVSPTANLIKPAAAPALKKGKKADEPQYSDRWPLLLFAQSDMAFRGDTMFVGNFHGFNIYRLDSSGLPIHTGSVVCPGGQDDVSVVGNLLIASVEQTHARVDCGRQGIIGDVSKDRFRGIRIYDISDLTRPRQVGEVQTCRGSHTHSVVKGPEGDGKILVYVSGTAGVRKSEELPGCVNVASANSSRFRIDIVEIPVANPAAARIIASPAVFADPRTGEIAGLWQGGNHGEGTQDTSVTDQCHDITVFPSRRLAAGACSGNGILLDISNPRNPRRIDAVSDPAFAYWHSATFNNDGTKVIFTDEWGGGLRPRCQRSDPRNYGADALYDIVDGKLVRRGTYKLPSSQTDTENCVAHNGSIVPVPGRDIMVQAWYQGGISVFDFTNASNPTEIAYFDRGPIDSKRLTLAGDWSAYYYRGKIYATEIVRGLDVLELRPSAMLSANEIAAAALAVNQGGVFNPQDQHPVSWPAVPVVARAYLDQLRRAGQIDSGLDQRLGRALDAADARLAAHSRDAALAAELRALAGQARGPLATVLADIARQVA